MMPRLRNAVTAVNKHPIMTPYRRAKMTPQRGGFLGLGGWWPRAFREGRSRLFREGVPLGTGSDPLRPDVLRRNPTFGAGSRSDSFKSRGMPREAAGLLSIQPNSRAEQLCPKKINMLWLRT